MGKLETIHFQKKYGQKVEESKRLIVEYLILWRALGEIHKSNSKYNDQHKADECRYA